MISLILLAILLLSYPCELFADSVESQKYDRKLKKDQDVCSRNVCSSFNPDEGSRWAYTKTALFISKDEAARQLQKDLVKKRGFKMDDVKSFLSFSILDKYIIKKYISTFGFVVLIFTLVACVIDYSEKADAYKQKMVTKKEIFLDYYPNYIPYINMLLFPLYALIAVIFFTSRMAYNSEVISIFNAGVSFRRLMRPYLFGGIVIASIHLLCNHYIVPQGNKARLNFEHKYIATTQDKGKTDNVHMFLDSKTKIYIGYYRKSDTTARDFRIEHYENSELTGIIKAEKGCGKI